MAVPRTVFQTDIRESFLPFFKLFGKNNAHALFAVFLEKRVRVIAVFGTFGKNYAHALFEENGDFGGSGSGSAVESAAGAQTLSEYEN